MNTYHCFFARKKIEVQAETSYEAQQKAAKMLELSAKKQSQVTVVLVANDGEQVEVNPNIL